MIYRPVRERDPEEVIDTVVRALEKSGQDEVSLTALSTADVSCISPLIKRLVEKTAPERISLGVASLRAHNADSSQILIEAADAALYGAKRRGRNTVVGHAAIEMLIAG